MCFEATGRLQGRASKLLRARRRSRYSDNLWQFALQPTEEQVARSVKVIKTDLRDDV